MLVGWKVGVSCTLMWLMFQLGATFFFVAKILHTLCDLSKVTRGICNRMCHLWLKDSWKNQSLICKFLVVKVDGKLFNMGRKQGGRSISTTLVDYTIITIMQSLNEYGVMV